MRLSFFIEQLHPIITLSNQLKPTIMKKILLLINVLVISSINAQTVSKFLDVNQVKALVLNSSDMHWDLFGSGGPSYEVPVGSGHHADFTTGLWIGGYDQNGQLYTAAQTYRQDGMDFWPGPLDTTDATITQNVSTQYDKIWKLNKADVSNFITNFSNGNVQSGSYVPAADLVSWPAHGTGNNSKQLAPFVDVNNNGIYDPLIGGDYPKMKGDQMLYYIFNDNLNVHQASGGKRMGLEIHATAYAYGASSVTSSYPYLDFTTFYNYKIINRSANDYSNVYLTLWTDADLGYYADDYIGCNVPNNFGYIYNADNYDESAAGTSGYGSNIPAAGYQILKGPFADLNDSKDNNNDGIYDESCEQALMNKFHYFNNNLAGVPLQTTDPQNSNQIYQYMSGSWKDNTPFTCGGNGYGGTISTDFVYPGNTYTNSPCGTAPWSEVTAGNTPSDRRYMMSSGPFTFEAGSEEVLEYAHCTSFDNTNPVAKLTSDMMNIRTFYNVFTPPNPCNNSNFSAAGVKEHLNTIDLKLYPNPTKDNLTISFKESFNQASVEIVDIIGKGLLSTQAKNNTKIILNVSELPSGIYFAKITSDNKSITKKFVKE